jgi:hypothetical protein
MPIALYSAKVDHDGRVRVIHCFLAPNEEEAEKLQEKHAEGCRAYGPAVDAEETIDIPVEVDTLPEASEASLEEFLGLLPDGEEEEPEEDEEEEEEEEEETEE